MLRKFLRRRRQLCAVYECGTEVTGNVVFYPKTQHGRLPTLVPACLEHRVLLWGAVFEAMELPPGLISAELADHHEENEALLERVEYIEGLLAIDWAIEDPEMRAAKMRESLREVGRTSAG